MKKRIHLITCEDKINMKKKICFELAKNEENENINPLKSE